VNTNATQILSNSQAALDFFFAEKQANDYRFLVVKNGVNINDFKLSQSKQDSKNQLGLDLNKFIIGHTGRFAEAKNHYFLLKVIKQYTLHNPKDLFVLVGKDTEKLESYVKQLEIEKFVKIEGYQKEIPTYLNAFDAFVFPSITEGQPNALIEAMISGLPIACSNISPILECLPKDSQHCTFNPNNVLEAVNVLENLKKDKAKFIFKGHTYEKFNAQKQFLQFNDILETNE
jgi:glycosyltransferase involved in cell wall biosynthesis